MIPILFNNAAVTYTRHGIGDLMETIRCETVANSEGEYELELDYPADGRLANDLVINNIILAKANDHQDPQAFRIYGIDKAIDNLVTVHAQHISYDLSGVVLKAYESTTCINAVSGLLENAVGERANGFSFFTNIPNSREASNQERKFKMEEPTTIRAALLDGDDSIHGCWGGDLVFDNFKVFLVDVTGNTTFNNTTIRPEDVWSKDRGVLIEYGIDMMEMQQETNISETVTGVFPYWKGRVNNDDEDDRIIYGTTQYAEGTFQRHRIIPLNVTEYYPNNTEPPSVNEINQTAKEWIRANEIGQPEINLTVSYAHLGKDVRLHDAITVRFVKLGIDVKAKVVSFKYDTLKERCIEVEVGKVKPSILFSLEDASRLKRGLIPPKRIQNKSIDSDKIANYSVGSGQIANNAIENRALADNAVTSAKVGEGAIEEWNIGPLSISSSKIKDEAVVTRTIGQHAVTTLRIYDGAATSAKIGESAIISTKINAGAVIEEKLHDNAVITRKLKDGSVVTDKIEDDAVVYRKIKEGNVDTLLLNDFSITSTKLSYEDGYYIHHPPDRDHPNGWDEYIPPGNGAITSSNMQDGCVVSMKIGDKQVANIKLVQETQDVISAMWEIEQLMVADVESGFISVDHLYVSKTFETGGDATLYIDDMYAYPAPIVDGSGYYQTVLKFWDDT